MNLIERIAQQENVYMTFSMADGRDFGTVDIETDDVLCSKIAVAIDEDFVFGYDVEDGEKYHIDHIPMAVAHHVLEDFDELHEAWHARCQHVISPIPIGL